jgi:hypothetical protein
MDNRLKFQSTSPILNIGIMSDSSQNAANWTDVQQMIRTCDSRKLGSIIWFAKSILGEFSDQYNELWGSSQA